MLKEVVVMIRLVQLVRDSLFGTSEDYKNMAGKITEGAEDKTFEIKAEY